MFRLAVLIFTMMMMSETANAECRLAEQAEKSGKINIAYMQYIYCAEEENDAEAQYKLGTMYYQGIGLPRPDFRRAVAFFSRSANNGYAPAQVKLGLLYWRGEGITKNLTMAHKWLYLAQEPQSIRWFYYVGPSSDPAAAGMYAKIDKVLKNKAVKVDILSDTFQPLDVLKGFPEKVIPSYSEVADFQHEKLMEAGEELMNEASQADLKRYLDSLRPDTGFLPPDTPAELRQQISNALKPVLLTRDNFMPDTIPVLSKLKKEIEDPSE